MTPVARSFNFADIWEMAADAVGEREALVVGTQRRTYAELEERANRLAHHLTAQGVGPGDHVALYLENCAEYVEAMLAAFKLRAVPINVNHRYVAGELRHLLAGSGSVGVLTQPSLRPTVEQVAGDLPALRFTLVTGDGDGDGDPGGDGGYEAALAAAPATRPEIARSGDDRYVIYTGGTTGLPKGVVWRQEDAFFACIGGGDPLRAHGPVDRPDQLSERIVAQPVCFMSLAPMMHAAAQWTSFSWLFCGGKVVLVPGSLDPAAAWRAVEAERVNVLTVVGDAVARPLLDAWDAAGGYDAASMFVFANGGAPMSPSTRQRIAATLPHVLLADGFGSSEAGAQAASRVRAAEAASGDPAATGVRYSEPSKPTIVVDAAGREVEPGSGVVGQVLAGGHLPLGYHGDPEATARMFVERDGQRWLVTGDMATVAADGSISLRGRGSSVVNTGGEKVYPEEVEGVLKAHPAVYDCVVVGVPDERWGEAVTAVVQPVAGARPGREALAEHCRAHLAGYKAPKHVVLVERVVRSPSGKADHRWARTVAQEAVAGQRER